MKNGYQRPLTFEDAREYLLLDAREGETAVAERMVERVVFVAYDVCAAFVIVRNGEGRYRRCCRDDLFLCVDE